MKLGLGTVQFGMEYGGELNREGRPDQQEVKRILEYAAKHGILVLDTSPAYGESERLLGASFPEGNQFRVVTKTLSIRTSTITDAHIAEIRSAFLLSLNQMKLPRVYGLLVHRPENLIGEGGERLFGLLEEMRASGLTVKIGISVYTGEQIERALDSFPLDLVQLPLSILDQRLVFGGHLAMLSRAGVEVHARSVFLQGALLMSPDCLPPRFAPIHAKLTRLHACMRELGVSAAQLALSFVMGMEEVGTVVCGIATARQLEELCNTPCVELDRHRFAEFAVDNLDIIDPSRW